MKKACKLIVDGKEFDIIIEDPNLIDLVTEKKKTGYEKETGDDKHYVVSDNGTVLTIISPHSNVADQYYGLANYYSSKEVAENNARADRLMRKLRRFAVEHREKDINWGNSSQPKYFISYFDYGMEIQGSYSAKTQGIVYFDSRDTADKAIKEFKDELLWYFTKYKDSL